MIDFAIVEALEQHYKTADGYVKQLESKRIKLPRDRKANERQFSETIFYWNALHPSAIFCFTAKLNLSAHSSRPPVLSASANI